jgi:hypothetical protein
VGPVLLVNAVPVFVESIRTPTAWMPGPPRRSSRPKPAPFCRCTWACVSPTWMLCPQIDAFSQAIQGGPIPPSCGRDGYVDMAVIEAIYGGAQAGIPQAVKLHCNVET